MKRRVLQFSLRWLLGVVVLGCLLLGTRHLLETYASYMEVVGISIGDWATVKGRIVRVFGPPKLCVRLRSCNVDEIAGVTSSKQWIERLWLCCYDFADKAAIDTPGNWIVEAREDEYTDIAVSNLFKVTAPESEQLPDAAP